MEVKKKCIPNIPQSHKFNQCSGEQADSLLKWMIETDLVPVLSLVQRISTLQFLTNRAGSKMGLLNDYGYILFLCPLRMLEKLRIVFAQPASPPPPQPPRGRDLARHIINPHRACARGLPLSVCLCVTFDFGEAAIFRETYISTF